MVVLLNIFFFPTLVSFSDFSWERFEFTGCMRVLTIQVIFVCSFMIVASFKFMTSISFLNSTWFVQFYDVPGALDRFCSIDFTCLSHNYVNNFFFFSRVNYKNNSYWRSDFYFIFAQKSVNLSYFDCFAHSTLEVFLSIFRLKAIFILCGCMNPGKFHKYGLIQVVLQLPP